MASAVVEQERAAMVAAAKAALEAEPVHRLDWRCPAGCGQSFAVEARSSELEWYAVILAKTARRHRCP